MTLDDELISSLLFHPHREAFGYSAQGMPTTTLCDGAEVGGYFHDNPDGDTLLLFFHGNGELAADYDGLLGVYVCGGASFWVVDYRGYGRSTGTPTYSRMLEDCRGRTGRYGEDSDASGEAFRAHAGHGSINGQHGSRTSRCDAPSTLRGTHSR